jgi:2-oxoglutarate dehydrogenase E2 component (dihydrolipoamide succinyltransferase)
MSETLVRMPRLADTLVEGTVGHWLKQVGEMVDQGEPLASIETDKVTTELTAPAAGTLLELLVPEGRTVAVETAIARIGDAASASVAHRDLKPPAPKEACPRKTTPVAARLLADHGLSPADVPTGSTRITRDDVLRVVAARGQPARQLEPVLVDSASAPTLMVPARAAAGQVIPLSSMRRAIAEHMARAHQTIPHGQTVMAADLTDLVPWRDSCKAAFQRDEGANLTFTVLFAHALARALGEHIGDTVDIGVAVALDAGLIVPVLRQADALDLGATARGLADLAARARASQLNPGELQGAHMTLTNVGSFGNLTASPIIPLGQRGILAPGLVERRPLPAAGGGIRSGWRCLLSLGFDRREFDDLAADRFLRGVIERLTAPAR